MKKIGLKNNCINVGSGVLDDPKRRKQMNKGITLIALIITVIIMIILARSNF